MSNRHYFHLCKPVAFVLIGLLSFSAVANAQSIYTFDSLLIFNSLHGQDNWVDRIGQGSATVYQDVTPENGTIIVRPQATLIFNQPAYVTRVNDSSFSFIQFTGNETNAVMQFDATGDYAALFALGHDRNSDGRLDADSGEIGPAFGAWDQHFAIQSANADSLIKMPFSSGNGRSDWYRLQLRMDFTAIGGSGSGSLYYLNISDGDLTYQPVAGLQNINLQLNNMHPNAAPQNWNTMWMELLADGGNEPTVDNLVPSASIATGIQPNSLSSAGASFVSSFPNPFHSFATIQYFLPDESPVTIDVFDIRGVKVTSLVNAIQSVGMHEIKFDGTSLPDGVYYYRIQTSHFFESKKMVLIK